MGTETLYPHFLSFHARCGLIMHMQTIWQRACQNDMTSWYKKERRNKTRSAPPFWNLPTYLCMDQSLSSVRHEMVVYWRWTLRIYAVSRNNFLYPPPHATSHQNRRHHCPRQTILRDELSTSSRWFASQLAAFLLSNIAEQKSRPSPSKSGMGGRYFILSTINSIYIMRWLMSASNFPKLPADKTQRTDRWAATVF